MESSGSNKISFSDLIEGDNFFSNKDYEETLRMFNTEKVNRHGSPHGSIKIKFGNCQFRKGISFQIKSNVLNFRKLEIEFNNCYLVDDNEYGREGVIATVTNNSTINIKFINCVVEGITIKEFTFHSLLLYNSVFPNTGISITKSQIEKVQISNCVGKIYLFDCDKSRVNIFYQNPIHNCGTNVSSLISQLNKESKIDKIFFFPTVYNISNARIVDVRFTILDMTGTGKEENRCCDTLSETHNLSQEDIEKSDISIHFNLSKNANEEIKLRKGIFNNLSFKGRSQVKLSIKGVKCNQFILNEFSSSKTEIDDFRSRSTNSKFHISYSDLKNTWFKMSDFGSFSSVNIYRSTIERAVFTASTFPKQISSFESLDVTSDSENLIEDQFENYKQLKLALFSQGNQIQALQMHDKMYATIRKSKYLSAQDRFILCLNDFSNKHGTSILRPFIISLILIFTLFILYCFSLPNFPFKLGMSNRISIYKAVTEGGSFLYNNFKSIFILSNPIHRIESLISINKNIPLSGWSYFISFLSRILIAWIFYQFIIAFRKFGKSI